MHSPPLLLLQEWSRQSAATGVSAALLIVGVALAGATIFGNIRGNVLDPQHRPIQGAQATVRARTSAWSQTTRSGAEGEFEFNAIPLGEYSITAAAQGFNTMERHVVVTSGSTPILHFPLTPAPVTHQVRVSQSPKLVDTAATATETIVSRTQIAETPGADRTNSHAMITDYVPGATIRADLLKIRGGEQVSWLVDGVPVPNTNIGVNLGPQLDPKDIDYIELKRGGCSAEYGGLSYGVSNVITRSGFERNNEGEVVTSYGNFNETNDQVSVGSHTDRVAYYASLNGNRTDLGPATPTSRVLHDLGSGMGGFGSLIFNVAGGDQLRLVTALRRDHYQVPNTPDEQILEIRDINRESDAFVNLSWVDIVRSGIVLTVSPFYHFIRARYVGGHGDTPLIPTNDRASNYVGAQASLAVVAGKNNLRLGGETFAQHDKVQFGVKATEARGLAFTEQIRPWGNLEALFLEDQCWLAPWFTLTGGARFTRYSGLIRELGADPRVGAVILLPRLHWVLHGFYGRFYQPPPLETVSGPLLQFGLQNGFGSLPLHGERDEEYGFGLTIPVHDWVLDVRNFLTRASDFLDHNVLGNSNLFLPLTIQQARIRGCEATLRSPRLITRAQVYLAYSN